MFDFIDSQIVDLNVISSAINARKRYELFMLFFKPIFIMFVVINSRHIIGLFLLFELIYFKISILYDRRKYYNKMSNAIGDKFISYRDIVVNKSSDANATMIVAKCLEKLPISVIKEFCSYGGKVEVVDKCISTSRRKNKSIAGFFSYRDDGTPYIQIGVENYFAIEHEFGHFIDATNKYKSYSLKFWLSFWIERFKYHFTRCIITYDLYLYGHYQTCEEWFAESFAFICKYGSDVAEKEIPMSNKVVSESVIYLNNKWNTES